MIGTMNKWVRLQVNGRVSEDLDKAMAMRMEKEGWEKVELVRRALEKFLADELDLIRPNQ